MTWFLCAGLKSLAFSVNIEFYFVLSTLTWCKYSGHKLPGFSVIIGLDFVFVWVVEIDLIPLMGIELDLISGWGSELTWLWCGGRKGLGFSLEIKIDCFFVRGWDFFVFVGAENDLVSVFRSKLNLFMWGIELDMIPV